MLTIVSDRYFNPSMQILRAKIAEICGERIKLFYGEVLNRKDKIICNYGRGDIDAKCLNTSEVIQLFSNKLRFSRRVADAFATPQYTPIPGGVGFPNDIKFPVMVRDSLTLSGGRGIHIINSKEELKQFAPIKGYRYLTPFIKTVFELRVHMLGGQPVKLFKKVWGVEGEKEPEYPIRVLHSGNYHFSLVGLENYPKILPTIERFNSVFGTNLFCAIDIGWIKETGYVVFEANSAPGLNENTAEVYAKYILANAGL